MPRPIAARVAPPPEVAPAPRKRYRSTYQTIVLTADDPVQLILPDSDLRVIAYVVTLDNDIVLSNNFGDAQSALNVKSGTPFPIGCLVPAKGTGGASFPFPVIDSARVYAGVTTTATNSRVAITAVYRSE